MRIVRYQHGQGARLGLVEGDEVRAAGGELFGELLPGERVGRLGELQLLPPVAPSKIVAVGLNHADDVALSGATRAPSQEPVIYLKPPSSLLAPRGTIVLPAGAGAVHCEAELAVVIGRRAQRVREAEAYDYILGLTCANDVSAQGYQWQDGQWAHAGCPLGGAFDTFCPLGPSIATGLRADCLAIRCRLNGEVRQSASMAELPYSVPYLVQVISSVMTLLPGDVILTGAPAGTGLLSPGDLVEVEIEGIGTLANSVAAAG